MTRNRKHCIEDRDGKGFEIAERNPEFEIGVYWKGSAYCWIFTVLEFAEYGALQTHCCDLDDRQTLSFLLANIGCVAFFAWFLANEGNSGSNSGTLIWTFWKTARLESCTRNGL